MSTYRMWTVTALDEFGRLFNYTLVDNPIFATDSYLGSSWQWSYMFEKSAREILRSMGEAASAEWSCEEGIWTFDFWDE